MEKVEFEKQFLMLVNKTAVVITAPNIAYHLKIGIEEAQEHILGLELNGVLRQETAQDGSTYYAMPNRAAPGTSPAQLEAAPGGSGGASPAGVMNPADMPAAPIYSSAGSAPAKGRSINGLVFNIIIPGSGSLMCGHMIGLAILGLLLLGLLAFIFMPGFSRLLAILPIVGSWIWSIVAGIKLLDDKESGPGIPTGR